MPEFDPRRIESRRGVLFPVPHVINKRVRRVGVVRIFLETSYAPARALTTVVRSCAINWTCSNVIGWYLYDSTTGDVNAALPRCSKQERPCPGSAP